ncbi:tRNA (adenosine(37)-N6)-threonylcarbamoyltransferase complex ATPase subunit type 1 TsaE [Ligilactobacillus equi]
MEFIVNNSQETQNIAQKLADLVQAGDIILLTGDLGAGKTTFTKGLAKGLGIKANIKSPTFTLIREYHQGRLPLYHMDVYRLEEVGGDELGLEEYFNGDGVSVVEWAKFVADEIPVDNLEVIFTKDSENPDYRKLSFLGHGSRSKALAQALSQSLA